MEYNGQQYPYQYTQPIKDAYPDQLDAGIDQNVESKIESQHCNEEEEKVAGPKDG